MKDYYDLKYHYQYSTIIHNEIMLAYILDFQLKQYKYLENISERKPDEFLEAEFQLNNKILFINLHLEGFL